MGTLQVQPKMSSQEAVLPVVERIDACLQFIHREVTKRVFLAQDLVARTRVELHNVGRGVKAGQISCKGPHGTSPLYTDEISTLEKPT